MAIEYYWKECFGVCLEGNSARHWLIMNDDHCEDVIGQVTKLRSNGHWFGSAFNQTTKTCETLEEAQKLTVKLVHQIGNSLANARIAD